MRMPQFAGVYRIRNRATGEVYIGCTIDVYQRIKAHVGKLNAGRHENFRLREAWATVGRSGFSFSILEIVSGAEMLESREQYWLDRALAQGAGIYNVRLACRWARQPKQRGLVDWSTYRPMSRAKRLERRPRPAAGRPGPGEGEE
jgi:group I intron endonuclease